MPRMRPFTPFERANLTFLVNHNVNFTQVEVTATGLAKGILDATAPMRAYFLEHGVHGYEQQPQGPQHKAIKQAVILTDSGQFATKASFYRPITKHGDPRMWIYGLAAHTEESQIHVLMWFQQVLYVINISRIDIARLYNSPVATPLQEVLQAICAAEASIANELLGRFRSVSGQWFEAEVAADTGIGRTIESFLGIKMNSATTPDYKGIELKSHRDKRSGTKNVLFTQTPDWDISALKSGREIVGKYGYRSADGKLTYQNTVQCAPPNSQSLFLSIDQLHNLLRMQAQARSAVDVAAWRLVKLHQRLATKHRETFWIEVENAISDGREHFRYKRIEHTRNPNVGQFDMLLEQNLITVDLMLCRPSGNGDTYSFKIKKSGMPLLFPDSITYTI